MRMFAIALMLSVSTAALAEKPIPLSRIQSVFESKVNKTEQMTKLCKSLQTCGEPLKKARMEATIMRQKYVDAGGNDVALIQRADAAIAEAKQVED